MIPSQVAMGRTRELLRDAALRRLERSIRKRKNRSRQLARHASDGGEAVLTILIPAERRLVPPRNLALRGS
jgi:hypothetical protein